jgi:chromosome segregation ATPase
VDAYVTGGEFPDISEVAALESDIEELEERVRAARYATEVLAGELNHVQMENREGYIEVLKKREQEIMDRYLELERAAQQVMGNWRDHATMVEVITGDRQSLDYVHPSKPILLRDPDDVVMSTMDSGVIT